MTKRTLLQVMATACLAMLFNAGVYAHSALKDSSPANGATVSAPSMLMLTFADDVRLVKVELVGAAGALETGFEAKAAAAKMFHVPVAGLAAGAYSVNWSILGADGHSVSESFRFTVDPSAPAAVMNHGDSAMPMSHGQGDMKMNHGDSAMPMNHGQGDGHQCEHCAADGHGADGGHQH